MRTNYTAKVLIYIGIISMCVCFICAFITWDKVYITGATISMLLTLFVIGTIGQEGNEEHGINEIGTNLRLTNWKQKNGSK